MRSFRVVVLASVLALIARLGFSVTPSAHIAEHLPAVGAPMARHGVQVRSPRSVPSLDQTARLILAAPLSRTLPGVLALRLEDGRADAADEFLSDVLRDAAINGASGSLPDPLLETNEANSADASSLCDTCLDSFGRSASSPSAEDAMRLGLSAGGSGGVDSVGGSGLWNMRGPEQGSSPSSLLPILPVDPEPLPHGRSSNDQTPGSHDDHPPSDSDRKTPNDPVTVPEPATLLLLVVGMGGITLARRRSGRRPAAY